ncbi:MAG TPA: DNA replication/repair protein RecF [Candidatus Tumulicola sp.]|jgi:DNA replication and repair protein RecF
MRLTRIALSNFRNYETLEVEPTGGLNAFVGVNAQGKSNLLEAVAMLGTGKSFRSSHDGHAVRWGSERAVVRGEALGNAGEVVLACTIARAANATRKTYTLNGRDVRYSGFLGRLRVVTFVPADLHLAGGAPSLRRGFLNGALAQTDPRYYRALAAYRKALQQKNALLRAPADPDSELLGVYDRALVENGTEIVLHRARFVEEIAAAAREAHARFSAGREILEVAYEPDVAFEAPTPEAVSAALADRFAQVAERERLRKAAVAGPHRDDLALAIDGRSLAAYGSQGQQRTAVLALKVAEYAVARTRAGEAPLLLLDDVLSELDEERSAAFLAGIGEYEQAFVTATHAPAELSHSARIYTVAGGCVLAETAAC